MLGSGPMMSSCAAMNNNIMTLIHNFGQLNNQLTMAINHAKLLQKFNKINKRGTLLDDEEGE